MNDTWQPIETAPKDGTSILVYEPYENSSEHIYIVQWRSWRHNYPGAKMTQSWCVICSDQDEQSGGETVDPTYWMPLPNFPN